MPGSYRNGLIARDAARQRQCPSRQIAAVLQQVELNLIGKMTIQCRKDLPVRRC